MSHWFGYKINRPCGAGNPWNWRQFLHIPNVTQRKDTSWKWRSLSLYILWFLDPGPKCTYQHSVKEKGLFLWYFLVKENLYRKFSEEVQYYGTAPIYEIQTFMRFFSPLFLPQSILSSCCSGLEPSQINPSSGRLRTHGCPFSPACLTTNFLKLFYIMTNLEFADWT